MLTMSAVLPSVPRSSEGCASPSNTTRSHKAVGIFMTFLAAFTGSALAYETAALGTPAKGSTVSGISVISGYHCSSKNIEVFIDGISIGSAGAGTRLLGTNEVCGRTDTGFSLLYNFNNLTEGNHVVSTYADGTLFGTNSFYTVRSGGTPWLTGANKRVTVFDFPEIGDTAQIEWVQQVQNFLVTKSSTLGSEGANVSSLAGNHHISSAISSFTGSCSERNYFSDFDFNVVVNDNIASISLLNCLFTLGNATGSDQSGFNMTGTVRCDYESGATSMAKAASKNLRYDPFFKSIRGELSADWGGDIVNNCIQRISFY